MQIFILDDDVKRCAQSHCDKHVIKQILEICQLLCTTLRINNIKYGYKITHPHHPCRIWLGKSLSNFTWSINFGLQLCKEYTYRYDKTHKTQTVLNNMPLPNITDIGLMPFIQAMPDEYKVPSDPVQAYRNYYRNAKRHLLVYTKRKPPKWIEDIAKHKQI